MLNKFFFFYELIGSERKMLENYHSAELAWWDSTPIPQRVGWVVVFVVGLTVGFPLLVWGSMALCLIGIPILAIASIGKGLAGAVCSKA